MPLLKDVMKAMQLMDENLEVWGTDAEHGYQWGPIALPVVAVTPEGRPVALIGFLDEEAEIAASAKEALGLPLPLLAQQHKQSRNWAEDMIKRLQFRPPESGE